MSNQTADQSRSPMYWVADLILALLTVAILGAVLVGGLLYAALAEFGFLMGGIGSAPQWQGVPLTAEVFTFLGVLCCGSALTAFGFHRLRAPFAVVVHSMACALLLVLTLVMAVASCTVSDPATDRAPSQPTLLCRSGDNSSECPGG
ncbi:hypothetical protein ACIPUC_20950 [Streptomyces sp. LARHCF249]